MLNAGVCGINPQCGAEEVILNRPWTAKKYGARAGATVAAAPAKMPDDRTSPIPGQTFAGTHLPDDPQDPLKCDNSRRTVRS